MKLGEARPQEIKIHHNQLRPYPKAPWNEEEIPTQRKEENELQNIKTFIDLSVKPNHGIIPFTSNTSKPLNCSSKISTVTSSNIDSSDGYLSLNKDGTLLTTPASPTESQFSGFDSRDKYQVNETRRRMSCRAKKPPDRYESS